jgi:heptosyltransferase-2
VISAEALLNVAQRSPRSILFIALQGLGNVLLAEPALAACRGRYPGARITLLVRTQSHGALLADHPAVHEIAPFTRPDLWRLRRRRFDLSYTCFPANDWRFEAVTRLIAARRRVGHAYPLRRPLHVPGAYTQRVPVAAVDDVRQNLNLVGPDLPYRPPHLDAVPVLRNGPVLGVHPGSSHSRLMALKRWPAGHFRAVIDRALAALPELTVWLFAGPEDEAEAAAIAADPEPRLEVVRGLSIVETARRIAACTAFLSNDSGLMHVAAACGVPTVALFGPTDPRRTAPRDAVVVTRSVDCAPCWPLEATGHRDPCPLPTPICLTGLHPERVWQSLAPFLIKAA